MRCHDLAIRTGGQKFGTADLVLGSGRQSRGDEEHLERAEGVEHFDVVVAEDSVAGDGHLRILRLPIYPSACADSHSALLASPLLNEAKVDVTEGGKDHE